ncbi:hypothetical protein E2C01_059100 [Portunus trituberculatus]|uniref:Uncharacterized protein n=1 Tax=Portunus trituberculatus TaxID=210409 RepID=A0A5B7H6H9_PORTR|nr:hypothetical protein [Portunus trituberculatus]
MLSPPPQCSRRPHHPHCARPDLRQPLSLPALRERRRCPGRAATLVRVRRAAASRRGHSGKRRRLRVCCECDHYEKLE